MESPSGILHRYHLLLKAHYFLFFSAFGTLYPILNITLRNRGLTNTEISYMNLIVPFLVFFTNPLAGFLADHTRRHLLTFNSILATVTILYAVLFVLPTIKTHDIKATIGYDTQRGSMLNFCASEEVATGCASRSKCGCEYRAVCTSRNFTFVMDNNDTRQQMRAANEPSDASGCTVNYQVPVEKYFSPNPTGSSPALTKFDSCKIVCSIPRYCHGKRHDEQSHYIILYSLLFVLGTNFLSNAITIGASIGFAALPRPDLFGEQRVCGTIGFGLSAWLASFLFRELKTELVYIIMFTIMTCLCIVVTGFIRIQAKVLKRRTSNIDRELDDRSEKNRSDAPATNDTAEKKPVLRFKAAALIPLIRRVDVLIFLSLTLIWGMSYAALDPYVYLYIDEIAPCQSHSIIGYMSLIAASAEVIALFLAARMLKLIGTSASSVIILLAFAVRFAGYYYIRRPYYLLFMESMHYFNFGILYVLIAQKADSIAPPGLAGTLQGIVYGVSFGLGRGVGLIVSASIYTRTASRTLFLVFACFNLVAAAVYTVIFLISKQCARKPAKRSMNNTHVPAIVIEPDTANMNEEPLLNSSPTLRMVT